MFSLSPTHLSGNTSACVSVFCRSSIMCLQLVLNVYGNTAYTNQPHYPLPTFTTHPPNSTNYNLSVLYCEVYVYVRTYNTLDSNLLPYPLLFSPHRPLGQSSSLVSPSRVVRLVVAVLHGWRSKGNEVLW